MMGNTAQGKEKLAQHLLPRQIKPFVDENLQMQLPTEESRSTQRSSPSPIYSHYLGGKTLSLSYFATEVNERELFQAMHEAEQAYKTWKDMQDQILKAFNSKN